MGCSRIVWLTCAKWLLIVAILTIIVLSMLPAGRDTDRMSEGPKTRSFDVGQRVRIVGHWEFADGIVGTIAEPESFHWLHRANGAATDAPTKPERE